MSGPVARLLAGLVIFAISAGCAKDHMPGTVRIGDIYSVDSQILWSRFDYGNLEIWTVDGPSLQALHFFKGIRNGKPLIDSLAQKEHPRFRLDMTANEIMEFVVDSLSFLGFYQLEARGLRPQSFGSVNGFRFELSYLSDDGLEERGLVTGAIIEQKLHLLLYTGVHQHYYEKHIEDVEKIIQSISILGKDHIVTHNSEG